MKEMNEEQLRKLICQYGELWRTYAEFSGNDDDHNEEVVGAILYAMHCERRKKGVKGNAMDMIQTTYDAYCKNELFREGFDKLYRQYYKQMLGF